MKKVLFACISISLLAISCSKSDDPTSSAEKYMSITAGSSWNYHRTDNVTPANSTDYTITSSNRDTTAAGKSYHVFTNSNGSSEYYNITGSDYYTLQAFSLGGTDTTLENLYLKDGAALNSIWSQAYTLNAFGNLQSTIFHDFLKGNFDQKMTLPEKNNYRIENVASQFIALVS